MKISHEFLRNILLKYEKVTTDWLFITTVCISFNNRDFSYYYNVYELVNCSIRVNFPASLEVKNIDKLLIIFHEFKKSSFFYILNFCDRKQVDF